MEMKPFPRYFAYGTGYTPPASYVRLQNEHASRPVDPGGMSMNAHGGLEYWQNRVNEGGMVEVTGEAIAEQIDRWNQFNMPKLKPPD
jgi:hypothetical protein